ncbi:E3 ubiquitin-protein ligase SINA-like 10 [Mercurialis annua]|uniref:E3 ubiquitin-protein ligase SINA-like 10 n=2 Tax=Mercurialis annua TaxID=3986 RepID=UPI00215F84BA|nr:E3 ubiquitin-protein ligase SINA-like 10 [Mercurialis annua]XP_050215181.1 E3 ubiquitin-protein ligase SINA-like 10 [Mercurialis annua]XP_050217858.1 E3 ubiquitin-protein ligase SINA-like 10 [Mercurialis annua]XP_050220461.1 E3 ubiquitin-protein ligase SINA-like 10 [Mercurialis annua]XP_050238858.1 E3 ubiquitin-protein ligase SINA-like 10 [Mercurialis annua]
MPENRVRSFDLELMDCAVCCEPLRPPIIQCQNGHATCNSCSVKMGKCHACTLPIGPMRCRIMEAVVESLTVYCQNRVYGCQESFNYDEKTDHEKYCSFIECSCPIPECNVKGSSETIYAHCKELHQDILTLFNFGRKFAVSVDMHDRGLLLQEEQSDVVFVLNNTKCSYGNIITVFCLGPLSNGSCPYDIEVKFDESSVHRFHSSTKNFQDTNKYYRSLTGFLLDSSDQEFFADGLIKMEISVYRSLELGSADDV